MQETPFAHYHLAIAGAPGDADVNTQVVREQSGGQPLVLEDLFYSVSEVAYSRQLQAIAEALADLIPAGEEATRTHVRDGPVLIPNDDFHALMTTAVPVQARVKLTRGKTTDKWTDPDSGEQEGGNLWYEEYLPSDCLFVSLIGERRDRSDNGRNSNSSLAKLSGRASDYSVIQIGGNETVGQGLCLCTIKPARAEEKATR